MKKVFFILFIALSANVLAQEVDTLMEAPPALIVHRDVRLDMLGKKLAEVNAAEKRLSERTAQGFRLQVLSTNDREAAMKLRSTLLSKFPEQKTYMFFQSPFVKLRFGNFRTKPEAEVYKKQISKMLNGASIYIVAEKIEVKPEKEKEVDEE